MTWRDRTPLLTRRRVLGGGLAGAGAVALAGCVGDPDPPDAIRPDEVWAARVDDVPADDPGSPLWKRTVPQTVLMAAQNIALPNRASPVVPEITVRALHDGRRIAFRLSWDDGDESDVTVQVDRFRDACAVLLGTGAGDQTIRTMGTAQQPVVLLHWKADWQRDMERGITGEAEVYPNRSVDVYPPLLLDVPRDVTPADYRAANATQWLPGLHVGNPMSADTRRTCVEKILAAGFGTSTHAGAQDAAGVGRRTRSGWQVVLAKPLAGTEQGEPTLEPGTTATCAFAVWSGSTGDAGSRKTPSATAFALTLEA